MNPVIYEIIVHLVETCVSGCFLLELLEARRPKLLHAGLWIVIALVAVVCTPAFSLWRIGAIAVLELIYACVMFSERLKRKLTVFLLKEVLLAMAMAAAYGIYAWLVEGHTGGFLACSGENCTCYLMALLLLSASASVVFQFTRERRGVELPWVVGTQVALGLGEAAVLLAFAVVSGGGIHKHDAWLLTLAVICMVAANISVGMLAPYLMRQVTLSSTMDYGKELSSMEYKYYEMSLENDRKLAAIRHDISNHIQTVYALLSNGENQRGLELIDALKSNYAQIEQMVYCENPVVNIILANKKMDAESLGIETHIRIREQLGNIPISDFDLSTVICNLLDNAIRGCENCQQANPKLIVEVFEKNKYLVIRVLNSCKIGMHIENADRIETTKSKSQAHGLGMPIVAGIARKHRGDFVVSAQNGIFTATVVMSLKQ